MLTPLAVALVLSGATIKVPIKDLTPEQREALPGTATLKVTELTVEQLRTAREGLERQVASEDLRPGYIAGLITGGACAMVSGGLVAAIGLAISIVPYGGNDGTSAMFLVGTAAAIAGTIVFGMGLNRAGTRGSYLERIEELDAVLKTRSAFREVPSSRGAKKFAAPIFSFTVAEF